MNINEKLLISSNLITSFGNNMTNMVLVLLVFKITNSTMAVSFLLLINMIVTIVINPFVFSFIDRISPKKMLISCEFISAILLLPKLQ
jgi:MFS family permease